MSKSSRRKKRRRKGKPPKTPHARLRALADALNRCESGGTPVQFAGRAIFTEGGVILPPLKKGQRWEARPVPGLQEHIKRSG